MSRIVDDDPPIKTGVSTQAYRDNWERVFGDDVIEKAMQPNESPVIEERTFRDADTGAEIDVTVHKDGTVTVVAERIPDDEEPRIGYAGNVTLHSDGSVEIDAVDEASRKKLEALCTQDGWNGTFPIDEKPEDAIECRLTSYMNIGPAPLEARIGPIEEPDLTAIEKQMGPHPARKNFAVGAAAVEIGWTCPVCCGADTSREVSEIGHDEGWFQCAPHDGDLSDGSNRLRHSISDVP